MMLYNNGQILVMSTLEQIRAIMKNLDAQIQGATGSANALNSALRGGGSSGSNSPKSWKIVYENGSTMSTHSSEEDAEAYAIRRYGKDYLYRGFRIVPQYAKGLSNAKSSHYGAMDEPWIGDEMFIKTANGSRLKRIEVGDSILPANFTKTLTSFAKNPLDFIKNTLMGNISSVINNNASQPMTIDARLIVQGNVTEDMMPKIQAMMAQQKNNIFKELQGNMSLAGYRKSVVGT